VDRRPHTGNTVKPTWPRWPTTARMTGMAQVSLTLVMLIGYFVILDHVLDGDVHTPDAYKDVLITLLGVLTGCVSTITAFWFNRSRTNPEAHSDKKEP